jgi:hypothetical protein
MTNRDRLTTAVNLAMAAYLGFYVFGLVMSVYAAGDVLYFTIPAAIMAAVLLAQMVHDRRAATGAPAVDGVTRRSRQLRETRGY